MARAAVRLHYTWPDGGCLGVEIEASINNSVALTDMRLEVRRAFREALVELSVHEAQAMAHNDGEATAPDA